MCGEPHPSRALHQVAADPLQVSGKFPASWNDAVVAALRLQQLLLYQQRVMGSSVGNREALGVAQPALQEHKTV